MAFTKRNKSSASWGKRTKTPVGTTPAGWGALAWGSGSWGSRQGNWSKRLSSSSNWTKRAES